jgi:pantoate--beta-alanine ligase
MEGKSLSRLSFCAAQDRKRRPLKQPAEATRAASPAKEGEGKEEPAMQTFTTIADLRAALAPHRLDGRTIGLVPTMGYLHVGHMALARRALAENDIVVATIFVNPLQFGANEDLARYPRDLARDQAMLEAEGVHYLFAPGVADMYPRPMETVVDVPTLGAELEGAVRPGHFAGVATVVTKLFNIAGPDRAYFGEKDFQQLAIIRRMAEDLAQPVEVVGVATVREADGLACSSRNVYLSAEERAAAAIVPRALEEAERLVAAGETDARRLEEKIVAFLRSEPLANPEVVAVRDPQTLAEIAGIGEKPVLLLLFVRFGGTKLLDNRVIGPKNMKR